MIPAHSSHRITVAMARSRPSLMSRLKAAIGLSRQRARLAQLDDATLRDIGITRAEAMHEAKRAFWDAPDNWRA